MKYAVFFFHFASMLCTSAQQQPKHADISGTWYGTSHAVAHPIHMRYELVQTNNMITGTVLSTNKNNSKDTVLYTIQGSIDHRSAELNAIEIIGRTPKGSSCMAASHKLFYDESQGQATLNVKWKGSISLNTCLPVLFGSVTMYRSNPDHSGIQAENTVAMRGIDLFEEEDDDEISEVLATELKKNRYIGLLIGIDSYNDGEIDDLANPISDASKLAKVLEDYYSFDEITVLKNATRREIIQALDDLASRVESKDNLLIFYAGHGIWNEQLHQGYWLPKDASKTSKAQWLSNSTIRDYIGGIDAKHTLLISDACFSGGILRERGIFTNGRAMLELYKLPSRKAMTSGTLNTVPDESVFMQYLLKTLKLNLDPLMSADQLFRKFKTAVINNSPNGQVPQYGPIIQAGDEGGDFIFLRQPK